MKQPIRYFSIGLLISTLLLFGYYSYLDKNEEPEVIITELTTEEMVEKVEDEDFKVISNEQYIALTLTAEGSEKKTNGDDVDKDKDKEKDKEKDKDKKDPVKEEDEEELTIKRFTFNTEDGVVSQDIAELLEKEKIIEDKWEFLKYLEDNNYMKYIQLGEFTVSNDMSFKEIAEIITTYPGN